MRILEIGDHQLMRDAFPGQVDHWSTSFTRSKDEFDSQGRFVSLRSLPRLARDLASDKYDLVVVQPKTFPPWHHETIIRSIFRRSALRGRIPYFRSFGQQMMRGKVRAPVAVWDWDEPPFIYKRNVFLLDAATVMFKRELPPDHWRVFANTLHHKIPTPRFRSNEKNRRRIAKLRPISLGLSVANNRMSAAQPIPDSEKTADIFFAGRLGNSYVRERGYPELLAMRDKGYTIDLPDKPMPRDEFLRRCARAWMTWSPEGFGYDCFRTYEASLCGSVPILNRQTVDRHAPFRDGEHCYYYDVEPGGLTRTLEAALADRPRLSQMAIAARQHMLASHTIAALGRYVAETTLAAANKTLERIKSA